MLYSFVKEFPLILQGKIGWSGSQTSCSLLKAVPVLVTADRLFVRGTVSGDVCKNGAVSGDVCNSEDAKLRAAAKRLSAGVRAVGGGLVRLVSSAWAGDCGVGVWCGRAENARRLWARYEVGVWNFLLTLFDAKSEDAIVERAGKTCALDYVLSPKPVIVNNILVIVKVQISTILYNWIKPNDLPDVDGMCEKHDGITFHKIIVKSLRVVRSSHTQQIIDNLYEKLDNVQLIMWPGGMTGYFAKQKKYKNRLKAIGEKVTDAYLIRWYTISFKENHVKLESALSKLRQEAGSSGKRTPFQKFKDVLSDTFDFEIPDSDKNEDPPTIPTNYAGDPNKKRGHPNGSEGRQKKRKRWERPVFPKGSCKHHPEATDHTTERC